MTRTARSSFPRAISKDRSESKSGTDKHMRKDGGGPHGWGRLTDEQELENAAILDEEVEEGIALARRTYCLHTHTRTSHTTHNGFLSDSGEFG